MEIFVVIRIWSMVFAINKYPTKQSNNSYVFEFSITPTTNKISIYSEAQENNRCQLRSMHTYLDYTVHHHVPLPAIQHQDMIQATDHIYINP